MFIYEAVSFLKNVICPHCKNKAAAGLLNYPFRKFNALELNDQCAEKECLAFLKEMNTQFISYESGQIKESELQAWLDNFTAKD